MTAVSSGSSSNDGPDGLLVEHSFLKVPHEEWRKSIRLAHRDLERDMAIVTKSLQELTKEPRDSEPFLKRFTNIKTKLASMKQKFNQEREREVNMIACLDKRAELLSVDNPLKEDTRQQRYISDHLFRHGFLKSGSSLASQFQITSLVDQEFYKKISSIEETLENHSTLPCLEYIAELKRASFKISLDFEFELHLQSCIELVRSRNYQKAIEYSRSHFPQFRATHLPQITTAMLLFALSPNTKVEDYKSLMDPERWNLLKRSFRKEVYQIYCVVSPSVLVILLQAGLSSMKTPTCYQDESKNVNCPTCTSFFGAFARSLPFSHRESSYIVCRLSGEIMDENNYPMALPNGQIYSSNALKKMADDNSGRINCVKTGETFLISEAKKVYIL